MPLQVETADKHLALIRNQDPVSDSLQAEEGRPARNHNSVKVFPDGSVIEVVLTMKGPGRYRNMH
jgi:hypothetical protein